MNRVDITELVYGIENDYSVSFEEVLESYIEDYFSGYGCLDYFLQHGDTESFFEFLQSKFPSSNAIDAVDWEYTSPNALNNNFLTMYQDMAEKISLSDFAEEFIRPRAKWHGDIFDKNSYYRIVVQTNELKKVFISYCIEIFLERYSSAVAKFYLIAEEDYSKAIRSGYITLPFLRSEVIVE